MKLITDIWRRRLTSALLILSAFLMAAGGYSLARHGGESSPQVLFRRSEPRETAERFFHALCLREWGTASALVYDAPEISLGPVPEDELQQKIWYAFLDSWSWSVEGEERPDSVTALERVSFSALSPEMLTAGLSDDVEAELSRRVDESRDLAEVYDADGAFHPEIVRQAIRTAVERRLEQPEAYTVKRSVELPLGYREGRWQILANDELWNTLSGVSMGGET